MKLETVARVKGLVAVLGLSWFVIAAFTLQPSQVRGGLGTLAGFAGILGVVYAVKWIRLRRYMRMAEYRARVWNRG